MNTKARSSVILFSYGACPWLLGMGRQSCSLSRRATTRVAISFDEIAREPPRAAGSVGGSGGGGLGGGHGLVFDRQRVSLDQPGGVGAEPAKECRLELGWAQDEQRLGGRQVAVVQGHGAVGAGHGDPDVERRTVGRQLRHLRDGPRGRRLGLGRDPLLLQSPQDGLEETVGKGMRPDDPHRDGAVGLARRLHTVLRRVRVRSARRRPAPVPSPPRSVGPRRP